MYKQSVWTALLLALCLMAPLCAFGEDAANAQDALPITYEWHWITATGEVPAGEPEASGESYVRFPEFFTTDESIAPAIHRINEAIQAKAHIPEYVNLLSGIVPGGTGLQMQCQLSITSLWEEGSQVYSIQDRYVSLLFSAEGKMLSGRPSQVY